MKKQQLTAKDWDDVADLLDQFAGQCEIAYENHSKAAKDWLKVRLLGQSVKAQQKAIDAT